ncbi:MAG: E3 ubiquitin ligase family protein, partial [Candidatus Pacearchaeota archaeon]|nr:E3 ubiquitin ligase family protein [Candidatus Pacearchaeota archaeon]
LGGSKVSIGSFSITLPSVASVSGRRTIGYEYEESIIPVERDIYILGEAADSSGEVQIQKPSDKKMKYIISIKSEEELMRNIQGSMTAMLVGGIIAEIAGVTLLLLRIFNVLQG